MKIVGARAAKLEEAAKLDALRYDATTVSNLQSWFDANTAQGTTNWTSRVGTSSMAGQYSIKQLTTTAKAVAVSSSQTLSLSPTQSLNEFTLLIVCRQPGPTQSMGFRGTEVSRTIYGYNATGRDNYFSIGTSETPVASTTPPNTSWDMFCFTRNSARRAEAFNLGRRIADFSNTTQGFTGLFLNTTAFTANKSDMEICEILLFDRAITQDERQKLEGVLARKWDLLESLDTAHPFKLIYPDLYGLTGGKRRKKKRSTKLKRKTKKVRKARKRHTRRR